MLYSLPQIMEMVAAAKWKRMTKSELEGWAGILGDGYICEVSDPDGNTCILVMDTGTVEPPEDGLETVIEVYGGDNDCERVACLRIEQDRYVFPLKRHDDGR